VPLADLTPGMDTRVKVRQSGNTLPFAPVHDGYLTAMTSQEGSREDSGRAASDTSGESSRSSRKEEDTAPRFVIQRHDATTLHFDFRLEIDGVLVSWSIPKGPSMDPRDKRLAIRTEDHSLDYLGFEGRTGGGYGAGTVIVWDVGIYHNRTQRGGAAAPLAQAVDDGHLSFWLEGTKIRGGFALSRVDRPGGPEHWLLVKRRDEAADRRRNPASTQLESVLTGRTNDDLADS
jgi:DNA ligase D-like protein (predicted 3'-phosphoesterase)